MIITWDGQKWLVRMPSEKRLNRPGFPGDSNS